VVAELNPPSEKDTAPGPVVPIWSHGPDALGPRSIFKPASLNELSIQDRLIWVCETVEAARPVGATGIDCGVVADATLEKEIPAVLNAATR
jgi:hypothetical protein